MQNGDLKKTKRRFDVLDGLRGFAMMLVLLNHVDSGLIIRAFPPGFQQAVSFFFLSGKLGVAFFFILSGFLMAYLYSLPRPLDFIERRYTRIFPPFITMVMCMFVFRLFPSFSLFVRVIIMFSTAYILRFCWIHVVHKYNLGSLLIKGFLLFQIGVGLWYGFIIMRLPPVWYHSLPHIIQDPTSIAVNATLMLPLGDYIPLFDIVYWTLISEVLFYLLYPILIAPLVFRLKTETLFFKAIITVLLFPFFFGISLLFKDLRGLNIMFIEYFIYFFAGIVVARISKSKESVNLPSLIKTLFHPISFMVILFISYLLFINTTHLYNTLVILLLSIPFGFIVYGIFDNTTALSRFFSNKIVVFLGTISYSLYICSTTLIDGMHSLYSPTNVIVSVLFAILTVLITVLVSYVMHQIIEAPYFMFKPNKHEYAPTPHKLGITLLLLIIFVIITIFSAYSSKFNFFSSIASYGNKQVTINVPMKGEMEITENPLTISFTAHDNNLGVILLRFTTSPGKKQKLIVKVVEKGSSIVLASQETTMEIGDNVSYQIGVPVILNSLGKNYIIELSIKKGDSQSIIFLHTNPSVLQTVQQLDKKNLITHPFKLISHVIDKVQALITNRTAFLVMLCVFPLLISTLFI